MRDILRRPVMKAMIEGGLFRLYIVIGGAKGVGGITEVIYGLESPQREQAGGEP
jgi:hypothetical protein